MHQTAAVSGSTVTTQPNQAPVSTQSGLFVTGANSGFFSRNQFAVIPEYNLNLSRRISQRTELTIGYTLITFNRVARPGEQLVLSNLANPSFVNGNMWVQGMNFGLTGRF
jgi:hypothetical protein